MRFFSENDQDIKLKKTKNLPGFEITLTENLSIKSQINNPFFTGLRGMNIIQLPKKMKGFRDNPDLQNLLEPVKVRTGIKADLNDSQFLIFQPDLEFLRAHKLWANNQIFGHDEEIVPTILNYGFHDVTLTKDMVIGNIIVLNAIV